MPKHDHEVYDTDKEFTIDPISRRIINDQMKKTLLIQYDHNSEVFAFKMPRYIEGHDMTLCDEVQVHYNNIDSNKRSRNPGLYNVLDLKAMPNDDQMVTFTWLISGNATLYPGLLNFCIEFSCIDKEGNYTYRWNTAINNTILIDPSMNNEGYIEDIFPDILAQWYDDLFAVNWAYKAALEHGFQGTEEEWLESLRGESGMFVGDTEPGNFPYLWFDTSE